MFKQLLITYCMLLFFGSYAQEIRTLSLSECIEIAIDNNLNVKSSKLSLETARVNRTQANAQRYPRLNASGSYGFNWGRSIDPNTNLFVNQRINFNSVGMNGSVPLLQGMQVTNSIRQSNMDVKASELDLERAKNDISLNVASFYLTVILNKELVENARFQLESSREQLAQTKNFVQSGALPIANQLQQESQVATNEVSLINSENNLDFALLDLMQALLLPPGEEIDIIVPDVETVETIMNDMNLNDVYEYALSNQPEILAAEERVKSARLGMSVSQGSLFPSLSLNGNINTNYSDAVDRIFVPNGLFETDTRTSQVLETLSGEEIRETIITPGGDFQDYEVLDQWDDNLRYSVSLGLTVPILNGLNNRANLQRARIQVQQSEINAVQEQNTLYQTVQQAFRNAEAAAKTYTASQKQVAALEETFRAVENQYNNGAANFTDYQVANNNLFGAKADLSRTKYEYIFRKKILEFYQGKPLEF
ncbi:MAG: TolC family protein [Bacteroidota bacterium]